MDGRVRACMHSHVCGWMHARACVFCARVNVCVCMHDVCIGAWMGGWMGGLWMGTWVDGWMHVCVHARADGSKRVHPRVCARCVCVCVTCMHACMHVCACLCVHVCCVCGRVWWWSKTAPKTAMHVMLAVP